jgi:DNA modification methylase
MTLPEPYYQDGSCTIYHADCRELLPSLTADVMVTDPPYGMAFVSSSSAADGWKSRWKGVAISGDDDCEARDYVLSWWGDRPALVFSSWKVPIPERTREVLVWDKVVSTGLGALDIPWKPSWEMICVLGVGFVGRRTHGVIRASLPTLAEDRKWHPTPKPRALMTELLGKCPPGCVIDPFMGSGTTLRAAKDLGRKAIGIEIEERYCEIAAKRLSQMVLPLQVA